MRIKSAFPPAEAGQYVASQAFPRDPSSPPYENAWGVPTQFFAATFEDAQRYAKERGINEEILGLATSIPPIVLPSEWLAMGNIREALHAACWMGFVGLSSGKVTPYELLGDGGVIHNLSHLLLPKSNFEGQGENYERVLAELPARLKAVEAKIPGYTRPVPFDVAPGLAKAKRAAAAKRRRAKAAA